MAQDALFGPKKNETEIGWPAQHSLLSKPFEAFCKTVFKIYCPLQAYGVENLPKPPFIICANHESHLDGLMLMAATGLSFQKIGLIAAKDYFFDQGHRFYLHYMLNLVPIARGSGSRAINDSLIACKSFLDAGGLGLIIFPEGTRSTTGQIARFKEGAAILAHALGLPMVPSYVHKSAASLPKGSYFLRPKKIAVKFGRPFYVSDWFNSNDKDEQAAKSFAYHQATAELERQVRSMAQHFGEQDESQ